MATCSAAPGSGHTPREAAVLGRQPLAARDLRRFVAAPNRRAWRRLQTSERAPLASRHRGTVSRPDCPPSTTAAPPRSGCRLETDREPLRAEAQVALRA